MPKNSPTPLLDGRSHLYAGKLSWVCQGRTRIQGICLLEVPFQCHELGAVISTSLHQVQLTELFHKNAPDGRGLQNKNATMNQHLQPYFHVQPEQLEAWIKDFSFPVATGLGAEKHILQEQVRTEWVVLVFYYFTCFWKSEHWCGSAAVREGILDRLAWLSAGFLACYMELHNE